MIIITDTINAELSTFQNAGFSVRLKAFLYDYIIIFAYVVVLFCVNYGIILRGRGLEDISPMFAFPLAKDAIAFLVLTLPVVFYFTLQESSKMQATWGKHKTGLRVVNSRGDTLTLKQAFIRSLVKFLPWQIAHISIYRIEGLPFTPSEPSIGVIAGFILVYIFVGIFIASILFSKQHRTPYDWIADSYVIYKSQ